MTEKALLIEKHCLSLYIDIKMHCVMSLLCKLNSALTTAVLGGVVVFNGTFNMSGGTISGNTADTSYDGVYMQDGTFKTSDTAQVGTYNSGNRNSRHHRVRAERLQAGQIGTHR